MRMFGARQDFRVVALPSPVGVEVPKENRISREEGDPEALFASAPHRLAADGSPDRPPEELAEDANERVVKPDDRVCLRPDDASRAAVVSVENPRGAVRLLVNAGKQVGVRRLPPVRLPEERIHLDVFNVEAFGDGASDRRLAGAGGADHVDPARSHDRG